MIINLEKSLLIFVLLNILIVFGVKDLAPNSQVSPNGGEGFWNTNHKETV